MTPSQLRMARAATKLGVRDLAKIADVAPATITRFETEKGGINMKSSAAIESALKALGVIFVPENGGPAGIRYAGQIGS